MSLQPTTRDWVRASRDLQGGLVRHHLWMLLGINDIRLRYNRSKFGQFWITLSMGIFIGGLGLVYSTLFNQPIREYIPYLAVNITVWTLLSTTIGESASIFIQASAYLRQDSIPKTVFVMRLLVRNAIVFAHNLVIIPITFVVFSYVPGVAVLLAVPGLLIVALTLFFISLILGLLSTRFRDLPQIIQNALQLLFFVTPVMWRLDQMGAERQHYIIMNPFAALLRIVADPIRGLVPPASSYAISLGFLAVVGAIALLLFARFRARLVYWL